ncbi:MAG: hypothetical protein HKN17_09710 [Rhodothermales bacterium]|nr:hypothetical protein [Rhodothermales bacterium]
MHSLRLVPIVLLLLTAGTTSSSAQQNFLGAEEVISNGTAYYTFARPGEATIRVLVAGTGGGIYEVGQNIRMDEFLALLGGAPSFATQTPGTKTNVDIQLYRTEGGRRTLLYEEELEQMILEPAAYPSLENMDLFVIETRTRNRFGWRDGLSVVTGVSSVFLLLDRLGVVNVRRN